MSTAASHIGLRSLLSRADTAIKFNEVGYYVSNGGFLGGVVRVYR